MRRKENKREKEKRKAGGREREWEGRRKKTAHPTYLAYLEEGERGRNGPKLYILIYNIYCIF